MASGRLGVADLGATTNTSVYTAPTGKTATFSVSLCNRGSTAVGVRLALASSGSPAASEWIEYDCLISPNSVLERTGLMLDANKVLVAYASAANVSVVAWGVEE